MIVATDIRLERRAVNVVVERRIVQTVVERPQRQLQRLGKRRLLCRQLQVSKGGGVTARHDPGFERRACGKGGEHHERVILEDDPFPSLELLLNGLAEDAASVGLEESARSG